MKTFDHSRTGNFVPGGVGEGEVNHLPNRFLQVTQIFTNSRKQMRVIRCTNIGLQCTYKVKIILHVNLSLLLIKHVKRNSCLCHSDG